MRFILLVIAFTLVLIDIAAFAAVTLLVDEFSVRCSTLIAILAFTVSIWNFAESNLRAPRISLVGAALKPSAGTNPDSHIIELLFYNDGKQPGYVWGISVFPSVSHCTENCNFRSWFTRLFATPPRSKQVLGPVQRCRRPPKNTQACKTDQEGTFHLVQPNALLTVRIVVGNVAAPSNVIAGYLVLGESRQRFVII